MNKWFEGLANCSCIRRDILHLTLRWSKSVHGDRWCVYCVQVITSNCGFNHTWTKNLDIAIEKIKKITDLYAKSNHKLTHVICLVKQTNLFLRLKMESKWTCSNVPDAHFNAHASHNMNLRKQMVFRPFLQNVSQMHWRKRGRETKWECVCRLFWKRKPEFLILSLLLHLVVVGFLSKEPAHSWGYLEGKTVKSY